MRIVRVGVAADVCLVDVVVVVVVAGIHCGGICAEFRTQHASMI